MNKPQKALCLSERQLSEYEAPHLRAETFWCYPLKAAE